MVSVAVAALRRRDRRSGRQGRDPEDRDEYPANVLHAEPPDVGCRSLRHRRRAAPQTGAWAQDGSRARRAIISSMSEETDGGGPAAHAAAARGDRGHGDARAERAQPQARGPAGGGQRRRQAQGALARPAGHGAAPGHERPLLGAPADRAQQRAADLPAAAPRRGAVGDRVRLRDELLRRRGRDRRRVPDARPRHVDPPRRPSSGSASSWRPTCSTTCSRGVYEEPERTIVASEIMHAIIGHRRGGRPLTLEAGGRPRR